MREDPTIIVDLVTETAAQSLARVIEPLLRVAHPIEQLAAKPPRAGVEITDKIDNVADNQFRGRARCRRAQVGDEVANGKIDFVANGGDNRHLSTRDGARDDLFVELPQILHASATARDYDQIDRRED